MGDFFQSSEVDVVYKTDTIIPALRPQPAPFPTLTLNLGPSLNLKFIS